MDSSHAGCRHGSLAAVKTSSRCRSQQLRGHKNSSCPAGVERRFNLLPELGVNPSGVNPKRDTDAFHFEEFQSGIVIPPDSNPIVSCFSAGASYGNSPL